MEYQYYEECGRCMEIYGVSPCQGHETPEAPQPQEKQLNDLQKLTQSICGRGVTFYASDECANCGHYSGYGMPLCDTCEKLPGW